MKKNSKLLSVLGILACITSLVADQPIMLELGGMQVSPEVAAKLVTGTVQAVHDIAQRKRNKIENELATINQERASLGLQRDCQTIGTAQYEQQLKALDQKANRLERMLENAEKNGDKAAETVQNAMLNGWQTFLDVRKDEATRKTQIAVAGVSKAVENEGALQRLEFATKKMTEPEVLVRVASFLVLTSCGIIGGYYGLQLAAGYLKSLMGVPTLVRESSRKSSLDYWLQSINSKFFTIPDPMLQLDEIVLTSQLDQQIKDLAYDVRNSYVTGLPFRNLLLYGPPGTGKTMVAKAIAQASDMDYAIVSGADFSQFAQGQDVEQLHILLDWAAKAERGLVLFIDEVDAFAMKRSTPGLDQRWVRLLNAFLSRTGELSEKFMIIGATNHQETLDEAFSSRMHKHLYVGLPEKTERLRMLEQYLEKYIAQDSRNILIVGKRTPAKISIQSDIDEAYLRDVADKINGFSGRDIAFMIDELRVVCYRSPLLMLTREIFDIVVQQTLLNREQQNSISVALTA